MSKILIIEDSALSRRMLREILESAGHDVVDAHDGISGLERYFLEKPDLVTLDLTGHRVLLDVPDVTITPVDEISRHLTHLVKGEVASVHQIFSGRSPEMPCCCSISRAHPCWWIF